MDNTDKSYLICAGLSLLGSVAPEQPREKNRLTKKGQNTYKGK